MSLGQMLFGQATWRPYKCESNLSLIGYFLNMLEESQAGSCTEGVGTNPICADLIDSGLAGSLHGQILNLNFI